MKIPSSAKYLVFIALMAHITSCEDSKTHEGKAQQNLTTEELAREVEFGPWMSKAGLMFNQEQLLPGDYFAEIEGRVSKGENQYRAITKTLNTDKYLNAEAVWGLEAGPLCQHEIDRLRRGMERSKSQVFTDTTGQAIHQLIMVSPAGARDEKPVSPDLAAAKDDLISEISEPDLESGTPQSGVVSAEVEPTEKKAQLDSAGSSSDNVESLPGGDTSEDLETTSEPDLKESLSAVSANIEEAGKATTGVGAAIGALETPELVAKPEPVVPVVTPEPVAEVVRVIEPEKPEAPPRAVIVEDDEIMTETEGEDTELEPEESELDPAAENDPTAEPELTPPAPEDQSESIEPLLFISYKVVRGDTLSGISRRYKVSIAAIKEASGFQSDILRIGQVLKIPAQ